jgi:hypothetical protein
MTSIKEGTAGKKLKKKDSGKIAENGDFVQWLTQAKKACSSSSSSSSNFFRSTRL